jgi:hypothetical protein
MLVVTAPIHQLHSTIDKPLNFGYTFVETFPDELAPIIADTIRCYRESHDDLESIYALGSVTIGEWRSGISDLDVIGITTGTFRSEDDSIRRQGLVTIGEKYDVISFVDNAVISRLQMNAAQQHPVIRGHISNLATTGICVWGKADDFGMYVPTVFEMAYGRARRAEALMAKYRSGNLIEPFKRDQNLLVRSCAKAAIRALSGATILRGAQFQASVYGVALEIDRYVPEAVGLKDAAMAIINAPSTSTPESTMSLVDHSINLFYELYPAQIVL